MNLPPFTCTKCGTRNTDVQSNLKIGQSGHNVLGQEIAFNLKTVEVECIRCLKHVTLKVTA